MGTHAKQIIYAMEVHGTKTKAYARIYKYFLIIPISIIHWQSNKGV